MPGSNRIKLFICLAAAWVGISSARLLADQHVILITIDGCAAYMLEDPAAPIPTLRQLAREGATGPMRPVNPSVTWPNHTTLITGVRPDKHGCLFNGMLVRGGAGQPVAIDGNKDQKDLVAVEPIYDILHKAGMRTAAINWPCTRGATGLDDNFPDVANGVPHTTPRLRDELVAMKVLTDATQETFAAGSGASQDQARIAAAAHVIRTRKPHFMLLHLLATDSIQHKYGPQTPAAYTAMAFADANVRQILDALEIAGIRKETTIMVTADHGFITSARLLQPNVLFRQNGLLTAAGIRVPAARAQSVSEGGTAMVYLTDPKTRDADRALVIKLLKEAEGIADVVLPSGYAQLGLPDPSQNPQSPDLVLVAREGFAFGNGATGEEFAIDIKPNLHSIGNHGFVSTEPKMNAVFIAHGRGIRPGARIELFENIHVAPTMAFLLGQNLPKADGKPIKPILTE
jgi:predicted AlkP superfamily pyrophosphatase or phosphodiesterase